MNHFHPCRASRWLLGMTLGLCVWAGPAQAALNFTNPAPGTEPDVRGATLNFSWSADPGVVFYLLSIIQIDNAGNKVGDVFSESFGGTETSRGVDLTASAFATLRSARFLASLTAVYNAGNQNATFRFTRGKPDPSFTLDGDLKDNIRFTLNAGNDLSEPGFLYHLSYTGPVNGFLEIASTDRTVTEQNYAGKPFKLEPGNYQFTLTVTENTPSALGLTQANGPAAKRINAPPVTAIGSKPVAVYQYAGNPTAVPFELHVTDDFSPLLKVQFDIDGNGTVDHPASGGAPLTIDNNQTATFNVPLPNPGPYANARARAIDLNEDGEEVAGAWVTAPRFRLNTPPTTAIQTRPAGVYQLSGAQVQVPFDILAGDDYTGKLKVQFDTNGDGVVDYPATGAADIFVSGGAASAVWVPFTSSGAKSVRARTVDKSEDNSQVAGAWSAARAFRVNTPPATAIIGLPGPIHQYTGDITNVPFDIRGVDDFSPLLKVQFDTNGDGIADYPMIATPPVVITINNNVITRINVVFSSSGIKNVRARTIDLNPEDGSQILGAWTPVRSFRLNAPPTVKIQSLPGPVYQYTGSPTMVPFSVLANDDVSTRVEVQFDFNNNYVYDYPPYGSTPIMVDTGVTTTIQVPLNNPTTYNVAVRGVDTSPEDNSRAIGPWAPLRAVRLNTPPTASFGTRPNGSVYLLNGSQATVPMDVFVRDDHTAQPKLFFDFNGDGTVDYGGGAPVLGNSGTTITVNVPFLTPGVKHVRVRGQDFNEDGSRIDGAWSASRTFRVDSAPALLITRQPPAVVQFLPPLIDLADVPLELRVTDDFSPQAALEYDLDGDNTPDVPAPGQAALVVATGVTVATHFRLTTPGQYDGVRVRATAVNEDGSQASSPWVALNSFRLNQQPTLEIKSPHNGIIIIPEDKGDATTVALRLLANDPDSPPGKPLPLAITLEINPPFFTGKLVGNPIITTIPNGEETIVVLTFNGTHGKRIRAFVFDDADPSVRGDSGPVNLNIFIGGTAAKDWRDYR